MVWNYENLSMLVVNPSVDDDYIVYMNLWTNYDTIWKYNKIRYDFKMKTYFNHRKKNTRLWSGGPIGPCRLAVRWEKNNTAADAWVVINRIASYCDSV